MKRVKLANKMSEMNINQTELAKKVGASRISINMILNKKMDGSYQMWMKISKALEVDVSEIIE